MSILFGTITNRWEPGSLYFDNMFDVTMEFPWFWSHSANWVIKLRHGTYWDYYKLDGPAGPMVGKLVFHPGTPAPEADGSYVIGEFRPATGAPLPITVGLEKAGSSQGGALPSKESPLEGKAGDDSSQFDRDFVIRGKVVDEKGDGLAGVKVSAYCGEGSLNRTGETLTGPDGGYSLRFGPGRLMAESNAGPWHVGFQAATIYAAKRGYFGANLTRQGELLMADHFPAPGEKTGWNVDTNKLVLPNRPFELNFVLLPAAKITGRLHDEKGASLANWAVCLAGEQLPPSSSAFEETHTDVNGRFQLTDLPTSGSWWLRALRLGEWKERGAWTEFRSEDFSLPMPGVYEFEVERKSTNTAFGLNIRYKLVPPGSATSSRAEPAPQ